MLEVLEKTRETNMITINKQKVPDETSVAALNIEATRNALKDCFPVANSGYLDKPYIYNQETGIWEGVANKAEAQADVINYLTDQTKYASGNTTRKSFTYKIVSIEKNKHEALTRYELENVDSHVRQFVTHNNLLDVCEVISE